jgi:hypothetical protein
MTIATAMRLRSAESAPSLCSPARRTGASIRQSEPSPTGIIGGQRAGAMRLTDPLRAPYNAFRTLSRETPMDREVIFLVEEPPEGGYTARALGHAIFTEADTWEDLRVAVQDAVRCHFEDAERPSVVRLHFVRQEVLAA